MQTELSKFGLILMFVISAIAFLLMGFLIARIIRPNNPNADKSTSYESGENPTGDAWNKFNIKYFTIALIFILFEVEIAFLFPWATIFAQESIIAQTNGIWGWFALVEMFIFIVILIVGLAYVWAKGYIDWVKPTTIKSGFEPIVPIEMYKKFNDSQN